MISLLSYLRLAHTHTRFLAYGFTMTFAACAGQTVIIGAFGPAVRDEFGLSHTAWGAIYMVGTLSSAAVLPWSGQLIDRFSLSRFSLWACFGLVAACAVMATAPAAILLAVAIFLLRQFGQGLASHAGTTATARYFHADRGKALALVTLGDAVGKAGIPLIAVFAIGAIGWRGTYGVMAGVLAVAILPLVLWLLKPFERRAGAGGEPAAARDDALAEPASWSRRDVLHDLRFYMLLPGVLAPAFILTALFFHHLEIASVKGWSDAWMTGNYWIFAGGSIGASLAAGPLIDRITAARVLPAFLLPIGLGLLIIWAFDSRYWVLPYLLLIGLTSGIGHTAVTALWAEVYGLRHLGGIRALAVALMVFASAFGPVAMGAMMDLGVTVETICLLMALYCVAATALMLAALNSYARQGARRLRRVD